MGESRASLRPLHYIRRLCLAFPQAEEIISHGMRNYRVRGGKVFATYAVNHHGDGRIALWLNAPEGPMASSREHSFTMGFGALCSGSVFTRNC